MRKTVVGCDIDEVINMQIKEILKLYNAKYNDFLKYEDMTNYNIQRFLKSQCKHLFEEFCTDEFIEGLQISLDDIDILTKLNSECQLYFCTARHPYVIAATDRWLEKNLPWYHSGQLIRCKDKYLLKLDYLIDDYIGNLVGGSYRKIMITRPWNIDFDYVDGIYRVYSLKEAYKVIRNEVEI